ncbi:MAG: hypothetical protein EXR77_18950 [Myxococcales bacterium]|nr:hypothetical protein [Myxococcales bacterium]
MLGCWLASTVLALAAPPTVEGKEKRAFRSAKAKSAKAAKKKAPSKAEPSPIHAPIPFDRSGLGQPAVIFDPSSTALTAWYTALDEALTGNRVARMAVYGASHTAADLWTGELRRRLQSRYGDAGHGFLVPAKWNLGYRHQDLVVEASQGWQIARHLRVQGDAVGDFGLAGLRMLSDNPLDFIHMRTTTANAIGRSADRVELWFRPSQQGGDLAVELNGTQESIACRGDEGVKRKIWQLIDGPQDLRLAPIGNGMVGIDGVVVERGTKGVVVDQLGIPGMQAEIHLHWAETAWAQQLQWRKPDLIVLAYGTNDIAQTDETMDHYLQVWRRVLARVRKAAPQASCLIVGPTDRLTRDDRKRWVSLPRTQDVIETQRKAAAMAGCGHWDARAAMGNDGAMLRWKKAGLATNDRVHLTRDGYSRLAELFDVALHRGLPQRQRE